MSDDHDTVKNEVTDGDAVEKALQNVAQLRHAIDRGETGEKVDHPDPAAAPLGTDDETAGFPPTRRDVEMAARHELKPPPNSNSPSPVALRSAAIIIAVLALGSALAFVLKTRG